MDKFFNLINNFFKSIFWVIKPGSIGVRVLMIKEGHILLVKHKNKGKWYLPGGGVKRKEDLVDALRREIKEELKTSINTLKLFGVYSDKREGKRDYTTIFITHDWENFKSFNTKEIDDAQLFDLRNLPAKMSEGTRNRIKEYLSGKTNLAGKW